MVTDQMFYVIPSPRLHLKMINKMSLSLQIRIPSDIYQEIIVDIPVFQDQMHGVGDGALSFKNFHLKF